MSPCEPKLNLFLVNQSKNCEIAFRSDVHMFSDLQAIFSVNLLRTVIEATADDGNNSLSLDVLYSGKWHTSTWLSELLLVFICILLLRRLLQFEVVGSKQISVANSRKNFKSKMIFLQNLKSEMFQRGSSWSRRDLSSGSSDAGDALYDRFQSSCSETELTDDRQGSVL